MEQVQQEVVKFTALRPGFLWVPHFCVCAACLLCCEGKSWVQGLGCFWRELRRKLWLLGDSDTAGTPAAREFMLLLLCINLTFFVFAFAWSFSANSLFFLESPLLFSRPAYLVDFPGFDRCPHWSSANLNWLIFTPPMFRISGASLIFVQPRSN